MNTDTAVLLLLADQQRKIVDQQALIEAKNAEIEAHRRSGQTENAGRTRTCSDVHPMQDVYHPDGH